MYHSISEGEDIYSIPVPMFLRQLEVLRRHRSRIVLTFDDGYKDLLRVVDFLCDFEVVVFVPAELVGKRLEGKEVLSYQDLRSLVRQGVKVGLHGLSHRPITSPEHLEFELEQGRQLLGDLMGEEFLFSFPKGVIPPRAEEVLRKCGVTQAFSSVPGVWNGEYIAPRVAIRSVDDERKVEKIAKGDPLLLTSRAMEWKLLQTLKRLMGGDNYEKLKAFLLQRMGW